MSLDKEEGSWIARDVVNTQRDIHAAHGCLQTGWYGCEIAVRAVVGDKLVHLIHDIAFAREPVHHVVHLYDASMNE